MPITDLQTRFIAGHIPDWSGYEYLQPTLNKLITHNLLFDFTLPTAYIGAGVGDHARQVDREGHARQHEHEPQEGSGEKTPVVTYRVDYSRGEFQGFGFAGVHGNATNFRADDGVGNPITGQPYDLKRNARRPVRGRRLLHPRRLDGAGPAQRRPAEEGGRSRPTP